MTYISEQIISKGIVAITQGAVTMFGDESIRREIEQQRDVYEDRKDITNVLDDKQLKDKEEGKPFVPNMVRANDHGIHSIHWGINTRLKGAYACYRAGDEMECIRHILLALGSICHALNWKKASSYINEQNLTLFAMKKDEETV